MVLTETQRDVLKHLAEGHNITTISKIIGISQPGVTKCVRKLEDLRMVRVERVCRNFNNYYVTSLGFQALTSEVVKIGYSLNDYEGKYKYVKMPNHPRAIKTGYVQEQIVVMEKSIGRTIRKGEVVHHINSIRRDNKPENLFLFPNTRTHLQYESDIRRYGYKTPHEWLSEKYPIFWEEYKKENQGSLKFAEEYKFSGNVIKKPVNQHSVVYKKHVRIHALEIAIRILPTRLPLWEQYLNKAFELKVFKPVSMQNNLQGLYQVDNIRVKTTTQSVLFYPDDIYAEDLDKAQELLLEVIVKTAEKINKALGFEAYRPQAANIEITRQEIAFMHDTVAKIYQKSELKAKLRVGKDTRFVIDFSRVNGKRTPEAEFVHRRFAPEDARKYETFVKDLITDKFSPEQVTNKLDGLENHLGKQTDIMNQFAKQIELHLGVMQQMKDGFVKFNALMEGNKVIEKKAKHKPQQTNLNKFIGS